MSRRFSDSIVAQVVCCIAFASLLPIAGAAGNPAATRALDVPWLLTAAADVGPVSDEQDVKPSRALNADDAGDFLRGDLVPINDLCSDCIPTATGQVIDGTTVGSSGTDESSCGVDDKGDVWHCWTADCTGIATLDLCGSNFDTTLAVFDDCGGNELACNDDACGSQSSITMNVIAGTTYFIRIAGVGGATGDYALRISFDCCDIDCTEACCLDNECRDVAPIICEKSGGQPQGPGTFCGPNLLCRDAIEIDVFDQTTALFQLLGGPFGNDPTPFILRGSSEAHVFFEGPNEGDANDDSGNGLDEVQTELVALNLTNGSMSLRLNPAQRSPGLIEEQVNNNGGLLDVNPFAPGKADSFFDVFFEIELAGGPRLRNIEPLRLQSVIQHKPPNSTYHHFLPDGPMELFDENGNPTGIFLVKARHHTGFVEIDDFDSSLGEVELIQPDGSSELISVDGPTTVHVFFEGGEGQADDDDNNGLDEVETEMVALDLRGNSAVLGPVQITLHPFIPSVGLIEEKENAQSGLLDLPPFATQGVAASRFDLFFQVDLPQLGLTLFTQDPKILRSQIRHKPPAPGDTYENPVTIPLYDANGNPTGYAIGPARHIPRPVQACCLPDGTCADLSPVACRLSGGEPQGAGTVCGPNVDCPRPFVEVDILENTTALFQLLGGPFGNVPRPFILRGSSEAHVFFEGPNEGDANDDDGNGLDEVPTELVALNLTNGSMNLSLNPVLRSGGQIEEQVNNNGGLLDVNPFAPGTADSFFDVFFEIDAGGGLILRNGQPMRIHSIIRHKPPNSTYVHLVPPAGPIELLDENGNPTGIFLVKARHHTGFVEIDDFDSSLGEVELIQPDGSSELISVDGPTTVHVFFEGGEGQADDDDNNGLDEVETEMVALDLRGNSAVLGPVQITLHPFIPSVGLIEEKENAQSGLLDLPPFATQGVAASRFDLFFQVDLPQLGLTLFTQDPKILRSQIRHKPPAPGDTYENPVTIPLYDANGNQTGYAIGPARHIPRPVQACCLPDGTCADLSPVACRLSGGEPQGAGTVCGPNVDCPRPFVEVDILENTTALFQLLGGPFGNVPRPFILRGSSEAHVFFEGPNEGDANDDDGNGLDEVPTELVALNLTNGSMNLSLNPVLRSGGQIEEQVNNNGGLLDVNPFAPGTADSFFDVFFEIDAGGGLILRNGQPMRIHSIIRHKPPNSTYVHLVPPAGPIELLDENGNPTGIFLVKARHHTGFVEIDDFDSSLGEVELIQPDGSSELISVDGPTTVHVFFEGGEGQADDDDNNGLDEVETEMVALDLRGNSAVLGPVQITLHPFIPSVGLIEEKENAQSGLLDLPPFATQGVAASRFDLFFQVDLPQLGLTLFTQDPKILRSQIRHKPPAPGDTYENPVTIPLYDANGNPTGYAIGPARHIPRPVQACCLPDGTCADLSPVACRLSGGEPQGAGTVCGPNVDCPRPFVEVDILENTTALFQLLGGPFGNVPRPFILRGSSEAHVFFEGPNEGDANDDDGNGLDEVPTELVALNLTNGSMNLSLNPVLRSGGQIEEQVNNNGGLLDVNPFAPGTADSFFDVFFEIDAGGGLILRNGQPMRIHSIIRHKPPNSTYVHLVPPAGPIELLDENGNPTGIFLVKARHHTGFVEIDDFDSSLGEVELIQPDGSSELISVDGPTTVHVFFEGGEGQADDDDNNGLDEVETEMVALDLRGNSAVLGPVQITLHPFIPSVGLIEEKENAQSGLLDLPPFATQGVAASRFDLFFQVDLPQLGLTLFTQDPKILRSQIRHKPPAPGDTYENPVTIPLYDANGNQTGYAIGPARHIPRPVQACCLPDGTCADLSPVACRLSGGEPQGAGTVCGPNVDCPRPFVEVDILENTTALFQLLGGPFGNVPRPFILRGSSEAHVFFEGPNEGDANDDDGNGLDEVPTELVALNLTNGSMNLSLNPVLRSGGQIEEQVNNNGGLLDVNPFAPGTADSFFDVFFEIDAGGGLILRNGQPMRIHSIIRHKPPNSTYVHLVPPAGPIELLDENGNPTGIFLVKARHHTGFVEIDDFDSSLGEVELIQPDGSSELISVDGPTTVHVFFEGGEGQADDDDNNGLDEVETEMVALDLRGNSAVLGPVQITLHPFIPSVGLIEEKENAQSGLLDLPPFATQGVAASRFDLFFQVDLPQLGLTLFTQDPKILRSQIRHKPPAPGDTYENPVTIPLYDANGNQTGYAIGPARHIPRPVRVCCLPGGECAVIDPQTCRDLRGVPRAQPQCLADNDGDGIDDACGARPCEECGPGDHWIHDPPCPPGGYDQDNLSTGALVGIDLDNDCVADTSLVLGGPATVSKEGPFDDCPCFPGLRPVDGHLDVVSTEIIAMSLSGGGVTLTAGAGLGALPLQPSFGAVAEDPADPALAESFFDVFFEVNDGRGLIAYNQRPVRVESTVTCLPPDGTYLHITGCTPLFDSPIETANQQHIANLVAARHFTFPSCCYGESTCVDNVPPQLCQLENGTPVPSCLGDENNNGADDACEAQECVPTDDGRNCTSAVCDSTSDACRPTVLGTVPGTGELVILECDCTRQAECHIEIDSFVGPRCVGGCQDLAGQCRFVGRDTDGDGQDDRFTCDCVSGPYIEVDRFDRTTALLELVGGPLGPTPIPFIVTGPSEVHVFFEGPNEGDANDDDGDNRDEVQTELVSMSLTNGLLTLSVNSAVPSLGEIEELVNNTPGILDLDPFAPGDADSFFDVFFEVNINGLISNNQVPLRLQSVISRKPPITRYMHLIPPTNPLELFDANGAPTGIFLTRAEHYTGEIEVDVFESGLGELELIDPTGGVEQIPVAGPNTVHVFFERREGEAQDNDNDGLDEVQTEMVALSLTGESSTLGPIVVSLHPGIPSTGLIEEKVNTEPGRLDLPPFAPVGVAASRFDLYFQVDLPQLGLRLFTRDPKIMRSQIRHKPPAPGDSYENPQTIPLYDANGNDSSYRLGSTRHRPNPPCVRYVASSPVSTDVGDPTIHHNGTLWRTRRNIIRIRLDGPAPSDPLPGDIQIRELLPNGAYGPDLSGSFHLSLESGDTVLRLADTGPAIRNQTWYAVINANWDCVERFERHFATVMGDSNGDALAQFADLAFINNAVGHPVTGDDDRHDVDGDQLIQFADIAAANASIGQNAVPKPSGH